VNSIVPDSHNKPDSTLTLLQDQVKTLEQERNQYKTKSEELQKKLNDSKITIDGLTQECNGLKDDISELNRKIAEIQKQHAEDVKAKDDEIDNLNNVNKDMKVKYGEQESKLQSLAQQKDQLEDSLKESQLKQTNLETELNETKQELENLEDELKKVRDVPNADLSKRVLQLEKQVEEKTA